jgi:hypothetical protein
MIQERCQSQNLNNTTIGDCFFFCQILHIIPRTYLVLTSYRGPIIIVTPEQFGRRQELKNVSWRIFYWTLIESILKTSRKGGVRNMVEFIVIAGIVIAYFVFNKRLDTKDSSSRPTTNRSEYNYKGQVSSPKTIVNQGMAPSNGKEILNSIPMQSIARVSAIPVSEDREITENQRNTLIALKIRPDNLTFSDARVILNLRDVVSILIERVESKRTNAIGWYEVDAAIIMSMQVAISESSILDYCSDPKTTKGVKSERLPSSEAKKSLEAIASRAYTNISKLAGYT